MYTVFYYMGEFISKVIFKILESLTKKPLYKEEYRLTLEKVRESGWIGGAVAYTPYIEYRSPNLLFRPRLWIYHETEAVKNLQFLKDLREHETVYVGFKELASDNFFKDVTELFKLLRKEQGGGS